MVRTSSHSVEKLDSDGLNGDDVLLFSDQINAVGTDDTGSMDCGTK